MNFPHGTTVLLVSTTVTDDGLGNTTEATTETEWGPCAVAPRYATESADPRVAPVVVGKTVFGPPVDIDANDTVVIDGEAWQVDGMPESYAGSGRNPFTGWEPGIVVQVKRAGAS